MQLVVVVLKQLEAHWFYIAFLLNHGNYSLDCAGVKTDFVKKNSGGEKKINERDVCVIGVKVVQMHTAHCIIAC